MNEINPFEHKPRDKRFYYEHRSRINNQKKTITFIINITTNEKTH